jgi:hypothetical protein
MSKTDRSACAIVIAAASPFGPEPMTIASYLQPEVLTIDFHLEFQKYVLWLGEKMNAHSV